jgi:hypothetical protein
MYLASQVLLTYYTGRAQVCSPFSGLFFFFQDWAWTQRLRAHKAVALPLELSLLRLLTFNTNIAKKQILPGGFVVWDCHNQLYLLTAEGLIICEAPWDQMQKDKKY